jgi:hypothetical protein
VFSVGLNTDALGPLSLAASVGSLTITGFFALIGSAWFLIGLFFTVRAAPLEYALRRTMPGMKRLAQDYERFERDLDAIRAEARAKSEKFESMKESDMTNEEAERFQEEIRDLDKRADEVLARAKSLKEASEEFVASEDWKVVESAGVATARKAMLGLINRPPDWVWWLIGSLIWIGLAVFAFEWPASLFALLAYVIAAVIAPWWTQRRGRIALLTLAVFVALTMGAAATASGLAGNVGGEYLAAYTFKPDAKLADGRYVHLGDDSERVYLLSCTTGGMVIVDQADIANDVPAAYRAVPTGPSLWQVIVNHQKPLVGFRSEC